MNAEISRVNSQVWRIPSREVLGKKEKRRIMPVQLCREKGKPGYRWGESGKCYVYTPGNEESRKKAKQKASLQGAAIHARGGE